MQRSIRRSSLYLAGLIAAGPVFAQSQIEEIVVTAQKREQSLQEVPVSITAIPQESIVANRIQDVTDLSRISPNLSVRQGAGGSKIPQYAMRGIYTFGSAIGTDKGVSLYQDGVYIQNVAGSIFDFADIERVEVLRGPQGTLFGRNSTGGAISVITRNPSGEFGLRQDISVGNYDQVRSKTRLDLPQYGPVSVAVNYLHSERDGDVRNQGAGTVWDHGPATDGRYGKLKSPGRLGDEDVDAWFVASKFDFVEALDLSYKFDYSENDYTPTAVGVSYLPGKSIAQWGGVSSGLLTGATIAKSFYDAMPADLRTPITRERPKYVNNAFTQPGHTESWGHNLTAVWDFSDSLSVKNIFAYRKADLEMPGYQLDGLGGLTAGGKTPFILVGNNAGNNQKQWSDELQFNLDLDLLTLTAGAIHFHDDQETGGINNEYNTFQFAAIAGQNTTVAGTPYVIPKNTGFRLHSVEVDSDALYAQPEFHLTEQWDLIAGIRVTRDKKDGTEYQPGTIAAPSKGASTPIDYRDTRETWTVGVNYKPSDQILSYAKYVTGYISGGQLATIQFDPETADSAETGIKADLFDNRLRTNVALFHVKYDSIQQATLGTLTGVPSAYPYAQAIVPSADATAYGFEWENTLVPLEGLTLQASLGYLHFKFDEDSVFPGFADASGAPGFQEFHRPEWTGNLSAEYRIEDVWAGSRLSFRTDVSYKSKSLMSSDIAPGAGPTAQEDPGYKNSLTARTSWLANARIALEEIDLGPTKATVALWGKNIFDDDTIVQATGLAFSSAVIYQPARTYGVDLTIDF
jgi:iron complex outermembrane receptor protein